MKSKKLRSPPPPPVPDSDSESEAESADEQSELAPETEFESDPEDDDPAEGTTNGHKSDEQKAGKISRRRGTLAPDLVFNMRLIQHIIKDLSPNDTDPFKKTLDEYDWSKYTDSVEELKDQLQKVCRNVVTNITMYQILQIARTNQTYLCLRKRKRGLNSFSYFMKEYLKNHPEAHHQDRFSDGNKAYKLLSTAEKQRYEDAAKELNIQAGIYVGGGARAPSKSPGRAKASLDGRYADIKSFFQTSSSKAEATPKKQKKGDAVKEGVVATKSKTGKEISNEENMGTVPVKIYDYFAEERKRKYGKEKAEVVRKKYAELSVEDKVKYVYSIMEMIEEKFHKRALLSKQDQDMLNAYEKRPSNPGTAYSLFLMEKNVDPKLSAVPYSERMKKIGAMWKDLDEASRSVYEKQLANKKAEYEVNYNRFLDNLPDFRREQENSKQKGGKRAPKRRASVGEADNNSTGPKDAKKPTGGAAAKRMRSKTIDFSTTPKVDLKEQNGDDEGPSSVKKSRKKKLETEENHLNGTLTEDEDVFESPKKAKRAKPVEVKSSSVVKETPKTPVKEIKTPGAKSKTKLPIKSVEEKFSTPAEEAPKSPVKESKTKTPVGKTKPKTPIQAAVDRLPSPNKATPKTTVKENKLKAPVGSKKTKAPVESDEQRLPSPIKEKPKLVVKENKLKTAIAEEKTKSPAKPVESSDDTVPNEANKKKNNKKAKGPKVEPEKPPSSVKDYFKKQYKGDPQKASKAFKKLPQEEKDRYYVELQAVTDKYMDDFRRYLESLTKEEIADFFKRNNE